MSFEIEAGVLIAYHGNDTTVTVPRKLSKYKRRSSMIGAMLKRLF